MIMKKEEGMDLEGKKVRKENRFFQIMILFVIV